MVLSRSVWQTEIIGFEKFAKYASLLNYFQNSVENYFFFTNCWGTAKSGRRGWRVIFTKIYKSPKLFYSVLSELYISLPNPISDTEFIGTDAKSLAIGRPSVLPPKILRWIYVDVSTPWGCIRLRLRRSCVQTLISITIIYDGSV